MKFRTKITLCMVGLLSVLFGVGGSLLISIYFQNALEQEQEKAYNAYQMVLGAMKIIDEADGQLDYDNISRTLEQLSEQNSDSWTALRVYTAGKSIYGYGSTEFDIPSTQPLPGNCTIHYVPTGENSHSLALLGALEAGGETLYLNMICDISPLFETRHTQQQSYQVVFLLMAGFCALLSYSVSRVLTFPLARLSRASHAIANGQLSSRAHIHSQDELGVVAQDFNAMAEALESNIGQLKDSVQRQERFMASFAHEAKTPMTSIIGYADLIRSGALHTEEVAEAANYIVAEGKRLENLSQKLLDMLVLKHTEATFITIQPALLIQSLAAHLEPVYAQQGITLTCTCEEGMCRLEPDLVKSLLVNLWDNARKALAGQKGSIHVRSKMLPDGCRIVVEDSGPGIPSTALEHLTEAFYRVDKSRARQQGGVGLGLSLCQEIALLHNGSIQFESKMGQGATVIVELRGGAA